MTATKIISRAAVLEKMTAMMTGANVSVREICEETGSSHSTISRMIASGIKDGSFVCVVKTQRLLKSGFLNGVRAARYTVSETREQAAETLIYRLIDKLVEHDLDDHEVALVREAQIFIRAHFISEVSK